MKPFFAWENPKVPLASITGTYSQFGNSRGYSFTCKIYELLPRSPVIKVAIILGETGSPSKGSRPLADTETYIHIGCNRQSLLARFGSVQPTPAQNKHSTIMIAIFEPNQQASSLYTETESHLNPHLQAEPNTDRQLLKENSSEDSDTLDFDYLTDFGGDKALIEEAKAVSKSFISFLRRTFKDLTRLGTELWEVCNKCVNSLGKTEGKEKFNRWLSSEFGNSQNLARTAMSLSQWYNSLRPAMQRVVAKNVKNWSVAALKKLTSLTDELVAVLVKSGKQTAKSIERAIATSLANELAPLPAEEGDRPITPSDWSNLRERFNLRPRHIKVLKQKAESLASLSASTAPVVKVSHVNEAIAIQRRQTPVDSS